VPIGHLGVNVSDLVSAKTYFDELMPLLAFEPFVESEGQFSYRPAGDKLGTRRCGTAKRVLSSEAGEGSSRWKRLFMSSGAAGRVQARSGSHDKHRPFASAAT
jgi:hypothetical protein